MRAYRFLVTGRAYRFLVTGRVQGVGFRAYVQAEARRMGYTGKSAGWQRGSRGGGAGFLARGLLSATAAARPRDARARAF